MSANVSKNVVKGNTGQIIIDDRDKFINVEKNTILDTKKIESELSKISSAIRATNKRIDKIVSSFDKENYAIVKFMPYSDVNNK